MWWGLPGKVLPFLLAASSPPSATEVARKFDGLYTDLESSKVYKQVTPGLKFSFVSPPAEGKTWRDDDSDFHHVDETELLDRIADVHSNGGKDKKIALYLPGLDGYGISAGTHQFDDLASTFELWRLTISGSDRSTFSELLSNVCNFVDEVATSRGREVILIGESFSGLLAPGVVLRLANRSKRGGPRSPVAGLVMVNPATSFSETNWEFLVPMLAALRHLDDEERESPLPSTYSLVGGLTLSALVPSFKQFQEIVNLIREIPVTNTEEVLDMIQGLRDGFDILAKRLPAELLEHRVNGWLSSGYSVINPRLSEIEVPTLLVVGNNDNLLPSQKEADRLVETLPNCKKLAVSGGGHFVLDGQVNLTEAIIFSDIDPLNLKAKKPYDPIVDWKLPPPDEIAETIEKDIKPLRQAFSPVFFSTDSNGNRWKGLSKFPASKRPLLVVSNHQLLGLDLGLVFSQLLEECGVVVRGLAHPAIFDADEIGELQGRTPGLVQQSGGAFNTNAFKQFGAVMVTPKNFYRLMQTGQNALLFPGGVREVFHGRDEAYELFWPEKVDFVRTAARFNATIVPLSAVGMAESLNQVLESTEVENIPFGIGESAKNFSKNVVAARFDTAPDDEAFLPPVLLPSVPSRNYFVFGTPFDTSDLDPKDREACKRMYLDVKKEVQRGLTDVLDVRDEDPFKNTFQRAIYERLAGKPAPSFSVEMLNRK